MFFPLGILTGVWGVMMWPLFYGGHLGFYPNEAHARIMIEGFMGAFVLGFIGTAFPRLTGNRHWSRGEIGALLLLWGLTVVSHSTGKVQAGDMAFCGLLVALFAGMASRWISGRRDTPPPGFLLVFAGVAGAAASAGYLAAGKFANVESWTLARLCLFQGFLLLPLMGIGPYLLPRFFGASSGHSFDESLRPPPGWWRKAFASTTVGLGILGTFLLEAWGFAMAGQITRALLVLAWFALETPVFRRALQPTTPGTTVRWSVIALASGLICAALWPFSRIGSLHLFFVSGLGMVTMAVGARVILGHAGRHDLLGGRIVWLRWVFGLVLLAATTRMSSDFLPEVRVSHHVYAAWTWAIAALVWLIALAPFLWRDESSAKSKASCPRRPLGR